MDIIDEIKNQKQTIARYEKVLALEKVKKRKADTRRKIELGGLVIKSGLDCENKAIILGALMYASNLINNEIYRREMFRNIGNNYFTEN